MGLRNEILIFFLENRAVIERTHRNQSFKNVCGAYSCYYRCIDCVFGTVDAFLQVAFTNNNIITSNLYEAEK